MNFVLDTNIFLYYLKDGKTKEQIEKKYAPFHPRNTAIVSVVTVGELRAIGLKNNWGTRRIRAAEQYLEGVIIVDVVYGELIDLYAQIDAYSQNKLPRTNQFSARNMGKNDLWIAATAALTKATLLTSDHDFDHLAEEIIALETILLEG